MSRRLAGTTVATVATVACLFAACRKSAPPSLGEGLRRIEAPASIPALTSGAWELGDAEPNRRDPPIELVAAVRPPTSADGRVRILTFLALPRGGQLGVDALGALRVPPGTLALRIEALAESGDDEAPQPGWRILDARATLFDRSGERFHMLRPGPTAGVMSGLSWPRSNEGTAHARDAIATMVSTGAFARGSDVDSAEMISKLQRINDCASCHVPSRKESLSPAALVQKGTDASGSFQLAAVLSDDAPFEVYRARDANLGDPFVEARCDGVVIPSGVRACPDGQRARGHYRMSTALAAGDRHAGRVCTSRRALLARMDADAARAYTSIVAECAR